MFFSKEDVTELNSSVREMQKKYGNCHTARIAHEFDNSCDKWDCAIKCYCAQSYKDRIIRFLVGIRNPPFYILI